MIFDSIRSIWSGVAATKPGVEYSYKLVINDSVWITDPNAPDLTEDEWRNGVLIAQPFGGPYLRHACPALNKRVTELKFAQMELASPDAALDFTTLRMRFNGKIIKNHSIKGNIISFQPKKGLLKGENKIEISIMDSRHKSANIIYKFFYDSGLKEITTPEFYRTAVMYECFIRSFRDADGDGTGDFRGLTGKLPYLKDTLGINCIWLMPFNKSTTTHGYNVVDYYSVEKDYGSMNDYKVFLQTCKKAAIKIIMDFVINHTDSTHTFFLDAYKNPSSSYSSWYQFTDSTNTDWFHFGVERKMPKLNFENQQVRDYFIKVASFWLDPDGDPTTDDGVDGFRCDAAKEIPHSFWADFRNKVKKISPNTLLLGEVWDNANYLIPFFSNEFDMLFNYPLFYALDRYINDNDISGFSAQAESFQKLYPAGYQMVNFLANHDNHRAFCRYPDINKLKTALAIVFTLPGTPMIYYGDEFGMKASLPPDSVRGKIDWNLAGNIIADKNSIFSYYNLLINLRKEHPALSAGNDRKSNSLSFPECDNKGILCYLRSSGKESLLVLSNNTELSIDSLVLNIKQIRFKKYTTVQQIFCTGVDSKNIDATFDQRANFFYLRHLKLAAKTVSILLLQ